MSEKIKNGIKRIRESASKGLSELLRRLKRVRLTRETLSHVAWYGGLALLLVLLGTASWAFRARRQAQTPDAAGVTRAAVSLRGTRATAAPEATPRPETWVWPLEGRVIGEYTPGEPVWSQTLGQWQTHPALDIEGSPGEAVYACGDGVILDAWNDRLWGNVIVVSFDGGYEATYAGLNTLRMVNAGDAVKAGQVIASVGQSAACEAEQGWHLHFEWRKDGEPADFRALFPDES